MPAKVGRHYRPEKLELPEVNDKEKEDQYYLQQAKSYFNGKCKLSKENKKVLSRYYKAILAGDGFRVKSNRTVKDIVHAIKQHGEYIKKSFVKAKKKDIHEYFGKLREEGKQPSTLNNHIIRIKQFYRWLENDRLEKSKEPLLGDKEYPALVKNLKVYKIEHKLDETKLLSPEEIKKMVKVNVWSRNRAMIIGLYESACRVSELIELRIRNVKFDEYGVKIKVSGKTGERNIRLIDSEPYFRQWLDEHPFNSDTESYFFPNFSPNHYGKRISIAGIASILKTSAKRAKINKYVHPHLLRHSRLDFLGQNGFNERDLRFFAGWTSRSDMPDIYLHYGESTVERKLLEDKGKLDPEIKKKEEKQKKALEPKCCPRCQSENPATALYCNCGQVLDSKESLKVDEKIKTETNKAFELLMEISKNPELMKEFERFKG